MGEIARPVESLGMKRAEKLIQSVIDNYTQMVIQDNFQNDSQRDIVELFLKTAKEAKEDLKAGDVKKALELIDMDLQNSKQIKKHFIDPGGSAEQIEMADNQIRQLEFLKAELESYL